MRRRFATIGAGIVMTIGAAACSSKPHKPSGTPTDPVEVCERMGDVCRLDGSRLGVCMDAPEGAACAGRAACFVCLSQH